MQVILAVALEDQDGRIVRAWWRPAASDRSWTGPATYADAGDIAHAVRAGHAVFATIRRSDHWVLGPRAVADIDHHGRASIHLDGSPDFVDEALTWLARNWTRLEVQPD